MARIKSFVRKWMLVIAMVTGASLYVLYRLMPVLHPASGVLLGFCTHIQPLLLFIMLFLTFCKVEPGDLKPHRWQFWLLLIQGGTFIALSVLLMLFPDIPGRIGVESFMLCMICPTATACAVVTEKLGGDIAGVMTYTIFINLLTAVLVPVFVPLIHPVADLDFFSASSRILAKVFPLLIMPCLAAWLVRYVFPKLHRKLIRYTHFSFYIWALSLTLAILMATRALVGCGISAGAVLLIAFASILSCVLQFWAGKRIGALFDRKSSPSGRKYNRKITAGQSLGQKNTVFCMWMAYSFFNPASSIAGGFYSIWHNCFNTWQLSRKQKYRASTDK